jgi:hypothetical protein
MRKPIFVTFFLLISVVSIVQAQTGLCSNRVEEALDSIDDLCNGLDRNSACYGSSIVDSETVLDPRPEDFFNTPGAQADLVDFREIHPQPLDEDTGDFGVSLLNLQANIPNTIPGQGVIFLLMGDARLTNEVADDADAAPFSSYYFLPGIGQSNCYEADPILTIQTTGSTSVTLNFNGVETEFSPGTLLTITNSVCTIHRGNIIRRAGETTAVLLANETVDIQINDVGAIVVTGKRGISDREYERGQLIQQTLNNIAEANDWAPQLVNPPREFDKEPGTGDCDTQYVVRSGDTLHKIAQQYETSVQGIIDANGLENPRVIFVGQTLCIPNPGSGFEPLPEGS